MTTASTDGVVQASSRVAWLTVPGRSVMMQARRRRLLKCLPTELATATNTSVDSSCHARTFGKCGAPLAVVWTPHGRADVQVTTVTRQPATQWRAAAGNLAMMSRIKRRQGPVSVGLTDLSGKACQTVLSAHRFRAVSSAHLGLLHRTKRMQKASTR